MHYQEPDEESTGDSTNSSSKVWTLRCNMQTLQLGRKALTCVLEEKQVALARTVSFKKPEIRCGKWRTIRGGATQLV